MGAFNFPPLLKNQKNPKTCREHCFSVKQDQLISIKVIQVFFNTFANFAHLVYTRIDMEYP